MPMERFSHSREEIYAAVWAQPMRDACKQFGVSDVALAKICRRLNVPRPRQGYWQRDAIGKTDPKVPLPPAAPGAPKRWEGDRSTDPNPVISAPDAPPPIPVELIHVPETLERLHPVLKVAMPDMRRVSKDIWGFRRWNGTIPVLASEATLDRALRIMNALFHALEAHGHRYEILGDSEPGQPWRRGEAGVRIDEMFVGLSLYEHWKKTRSDDRWRSVVYAPSGSLCVRIHGSYFPFREWTDTKTKPIELRLHEVIPAVLARAEEIRAERIEAERRREEERKRQIRQAEADRLQRQEEEKVARLREILDSWREVRDIRAFIADAHAIVAAGGLEIRAGSKFEEFIRWAMTRVERIDPLRVLRKEASETRPSASQTRGSGASP